MSDTFNNAFSDKHESSSKNENGNLGGNSEQVEKEKLWLTNEFWTTPGWLDKKCGKLKVNNYDTLLQYNLQTRYLDLEGEFRTVFSNNYTCPDLDKTTACWIVSLLQTARQGLEKERNDQVNLLHIANILDSIKRYLVFLYPLSFVERRIKNLANEIVTSRPADAFLLKNTIKECKNQSPLKLYRDVYDKVSGEITKEIIINHINYNLQIDRLQMLKSYGLFVLLITILLSPLFINFSNVIIQGYQNSIISQLIITESKLYICWLMVTTFAVFGSLGGFMSGLLQIKDSKTNLGKYKEDILKFQLKPLVGAVTACMIVFLLSWEIIPGVEINNIGSIILISFITGFSERYFLKLINIDEGTNVEKNIKPVADQALMGSVK